MDLISLPFELIVEIASKDIITWETLAIYYPKMYVFTREHLDMFVRLFTTIEYGEIMRGSLEFKVTRWKLFGKLHRLNDLPAISITDGTLVWYINDLKHREGDLPTEILYNGNKYYHKYDLLHRDNDQPAVDHIKGIQEWYQHGQLHRNNDQPAIISLNHYQCWYKYGKLHRENNAPAFIGSDGIERYFLNGEEYFP